MLNENLELKNVQYGYLLLLLGKIGKQVSRTSLVRKSGGTVKMYSLYPEFLLTQFICNENALKGTEIVFY